MVILSLPGEDWGAMARLPMLLLAWLRKEPHSRSPTATPVAQGDAVSAALSCLVAVAVPSPPGCHSPLGTRPDVAQHNVGRWKEGRCEV